MSENHAHYLFKVLRQSVNGQIYLFNETDGEFQCKIIEISPKKCKVLPEISVKTFIPAKKVVCVFSLIKPKNIEFIIQKCTEVGVSGFIPLRAARSVNDNINIERLAAIAIEASEQSGRLDIPKISNLITIPELTKMQGFGKNFVLLNQEGNEFAKSENDFDETFIISGPEGGFTSEETEILSNFAHKIKISNNTLRSETASILGCGMFMRLF